MTQLQESLAKMLIALGVPLSTELPTMLYLETEQEQLELAQYLLDNLELKPSVEEIREKVEEILSTEP